MTILQGTQRQGATRSPSKLVLPGGGVIGLFVDPLVVQECLEVVLGIFPRRVMKGRILGE